MATDAPNSGEQQQKVEFTPEQQAKVNELIQGAMGRAGKEARESAAKLDADLKQAQKELADAKAAMSSASTGSEKKEAKDDVAALTAQIAEMKNAQQSQVAEVDRFKSIAKQKEEEADSARKEVLNVRKQVAIANSASKVSFVNTEVVSKLTEGDISWDSESGKFVVMGPNGQPRLNAAFEPMSLDEFYQDFAEKNPYLVRGDVKTGSGSTQNRGTGNTGRYEPKQIFGPGSSAVLAQKLYKENPAEYKRLRAVAVEGGLLAA